MKFAAILASASVAAAAAISKRDVIFKVSNFGASCVPHSTQCSYGFTVIQPGTMETTGVNCTALVTGNPSGLLPDVTDGTCGFSSRTFDIVRGVEGLTLTVSQPVSPTSNQTGSHLLSNCEFEISNQPNAVVQHYTGSPSFDLITPVYN
ncbi:hypersensitive response-inducing protein [Colletotrichum orchidophilum]|uniref:Hypersensitive response-inducing protein n=1 Tax=Colletotrichum orchidophilum TaxID=1209926 RepID=A0A1G4AMU5_9PEZI|nr:hypersensitive response-inducing protein [Colletotrichum orchidophilum]OHE90499.1 hypersensitive response-inducing protein [Colletotrichum orchidophilum]